MQRTRVLLHLIDITPKELQDGDILNDAKVILKELEKYNEELMDKPRLLALNKVDTVEDHEYLDGLEETLRNELNWTGKIYRISAVAKIGLDELTYDLLEIINEFERPEY